MQGLQEDQRKSLTRNLLSLWSSATPALWCTFSPLPDEADPRPAVDERPTYRWAYPRVDGDRLRFGVPTPQASWTRSSLGVLEPSSDQIQEVSIKEASGVLVPGLAFDRQGHRLGFGKGHYDRALKQYSGLKVGLAWSVQVSETELPRESHDVPLDVLVTEKEVLRLTRKEC